MTLRDDLIVALEKENDDLRARVKQLEEMVGMRFEVPPQFGLTKNEGVIFGLLLKNKIVTREYMMDALYLHKQDEAQMKICDVWVCKIRKKLKPYGISIENVWGQGYQMPVESKEIATGLLAAANGELAA